MDFKKLTEKLGDIQYSGPTKNIKTIILQLIDALLTLL